MRKLALKGGTPVRTKPFPSWPQGGKEEKKWLEQALSSSRWFAGLQGDDPESLGTLFGKTFAQLHGAAFGLPVANGSVAIEIGLKALGIRPGDEVIVPPYTFISTATSVLMAGAVPVFADIDPETYCLDPQAVAARITPRTAALIPVHLAGQMADMPALGDLASRHSLTILEDCAQAIDSAMLSKKAGTWGRAGTFSFQSNKTLTSGEGGLVMTDDPKVAESVSALRAFGRFRSSPGVRSSDLTCQQLSSNYRLSEFQSAVLLGQMERFADQDRIRQANASRLTDGLSQIQGIKHVRKEFPNLKHGYYYYMLRYDPEAFGNLDPEALCAAFSAEGIPFVPGDRKPLYRHPVFEVEYLSAHLSPQALERYRQSMTPNRVFCPHAEAACRSTILLRHQVLLGGEKDMEDIVESVHKVKDHIDELL